MECVICGAAIATVLETYGEIDAPCCQCCWLNGGEYPEGWYTQALFSYEDLGGGWLLKRLTAAGAALLGGKEGEAMMRVNRDAGKIHMLRREAR